MFKLPIKFVVESTQKEIGDGIRSALILEANAFFSKLQKPLLKQLKELITQSILNSPTTHSLLYGGQLQAEFGVTYSDGINTIAEILLILRESAKLEYIPVKKIGNTIKGVIRLVALAPEDIQRIIQLPSGSYTSNSGKRVEWLKWLLTEGDKIIIRDYEIDYQKGLDKSRSGLAIMVKKPGGRGWRVPPEYSGVEKDNFITKAVDGILDQLEIKI